MRIYDLKIDTQPFADLVSGAKTCEVRNDDRGFEVGDTVRFPGGHCCTISHIQRGYGLPDGLCVLSYAQPSAAPEQGAVLWCDPEGLASADRWVRASRRQSEVVSQPLYTHADPSEVERLRAERRRMDQALVAAANARDTAEQQLAEAQALLQRTHRDLDACQKVIWLAGVGSRGYGFDPAYCEDAQARLAEIDAFLSATAQPAEHESDCSTNNRGVPELLGPCDCKGGAQ